MNKHNDDHMSVKHLVVQVFIGEDSSKALEKGLPMWALWQSLLYFHKSTFLPFYVTFSNYHLSIYVHHKLPLITNNELKVIRFDLFS